MLNPTQIAFFREHGYLVLPGLADQAFCRQLIVDAQAALATHSGEIEYEADTRYPGAPVSRDAEGGMTARRLLQAYARSPQLAQWATGPQLAAPLISLLGEGAALSQAHHNCMMTKQPQYSTATGWHRDSRYWQFARADLVSAWLALGNETVENGCLWVIPGTHKLTLHEGQLDDVQFLKKDHPDNQDLLKQAVAVPLQQGDVLLFHSQLFHAAGNNQTQQTKFSLVFTYHAADNPPVPGSRSARLPDIPLTLN